MNGLTVSVKKTKWLVGGRVPRLVDSESLVFAGRPLERVAKFKYLGLLFTPRADLSVMREARLGAAKRAWGVLQGKLSVLGWWDR